MIIHLGLLSLVGSSDLPTFSADHTKLLDLSPGGVCIAKILSNFSGGLLHHRFTLTLKRRFTFCCTFHLLTSPPVRRHPILRSSDFPLILQSDHPVSLKIYSSTVCSSKYINTEHDGHLCIILFDLISISI